jgi:hypothetical protein
MRVENVSLLLQQFATYVSRYIALQNRSRELISMLGWNCEKRLIASFPGLCRGCQGKLRIFTNDDEVRSH